MLYTIGEIIVFLLLAALVGFLIGWLARGLSIRGQLEERFEREVAGRQLRINKLEDELHEARNALEDARNDAETAQRERAEQHDLTVTLEARLGEAEAAAGDLTATVTALQSELDAVRIQQAGSISASETQQLREQIEQLQAEAQDKGERIAELEAAAETARLAGAAEVEADIAELRDGVVARDRRIAELEAAAETTRDVGQLESELEGLEAVVAQRDSRIAELEQDGSGLQDMWRLEGEIERLRAAVAERDARIEQLQVSASGDGERLPSPVEASSVAPAGEAVAEVARRTRGHEPAIDDDLKRIPGIGPKIEQLLKSMGITSYRQVARFTDEDIEVLNEHLGSFRNRMRRDDWMSSAADLHVEVHGTDV